MAFQIPAAWSASTNYTTGQRVLLNGVAYEALADNSNSNPSQSDINWKAVYVHSIEDYNSLVEAVRLQLNTSADEIYNSVPLFINLTEESLKTRIRLPHQIRTESVMTELLADGTSRIRVPAGLLEIIHVRRKDNAFNDGYVITPYDNDTIELLALNKEEYLRILRSHVNYGKDFFSFDTGGYWWDNAYLNFAPAYAVNTEIEVTYSRLIPKLGTVAQVEQPDGTITTMTVVTNELLQIAPQVLLYGACLRAKPFLDEDDPRVAQWTEMYVAAEKELQYMAEQFDVHQAHALFLQNTYAENI